MTHDQPLTTTDHIHHLTRWHTHTETATPDTRTHTVQAPPLLLQLAATDLPTNINTGDTQPTVAESKPAARLEAIDTIRDIVTGCTRWITTTTGHQPRWVSIAGATNGLTPRQRAMIAIDHVQQLHGLLPRLDPLTRSDVEADIRHWWTRARIVTGWDSPPWRPDATCPSCGERGTLRVRLADRIALCVAERCHATWNSGTIGLLAEHVRVESAERQAVVSPRSPCWCPVPRPIVADFRWACPSCGSVRCHHALSARSVAELRAELVSAG